MQGKNAAIVIMGGSGQVGTALRGQAWPDGVRLQVPQRRVLDITDEAAIAATIGSQAWSCVINFAAYTAVDAAETDAERAWQANAIGPACLAMEAAKAGTPIIHLSTDHVFDGTAKSACCPSDPVRPLSVYGRSKAAGEDAVRCQAGEPEGSQ
jgi:dTDP-4-dehydrorhamnose reductase